MALRTEYDTLVVTTPGLEPVTQRELIALGAAPCGEAEPGAIPVRVPLQLLYTLNLQLRTASRLTVLAASFRARAFGELERRAGEIAWEEWFVRGTRVRLRVTCRKSRLYHTGAVAERVAAAIVRRSPVQVETEPTDAEPSDEQLVFVRLLRDQCTIRIDTSGAHLHRRGYRQAVARAPLRETLAAAMLLAAGWDPQAPLLDPFCGSGTIAIEAALLARRIAPGAQRSFAFMRWPGYDPRLWNTLRERARSLERHEAPAPIVASDRDAGAVQAARANAERAGVAPDLTLGVHALSALQVPPGRGWLVTNPPYGVRVGERGPLRDLYAALGRMVRGPLDGWSVALLSAHAMLEGQLGIPLREVLRTTNGGLNVRLVEREHGVPAAGGDRSDAR